MTHGSLFSGIGGFDLAAEWMGWENKFHCEWNPFGQKVLKHYWPEAESFYDITKTDFKPYANQIDILTGGFPCQPYSLAGKRKGKDDERHLWPEMLRAIREIQPRWVVGENVFGLINWSNGLVFHEVQADLEAAGYEVWPYVLPAVSVNAPHRRDRVWFVAYLQSGGCIKSQKFNGRAKHKQDNWEKVWNTATSNGQKSNAPNTENNRFQRQWGFGETSTSEKYISTVCTDEGTGSQNVKHTYSKGFGNGCEKHVSNEQRFNIGGYFESNERDAAHTECIRPSREKHRAEESGQLTKTNSGSGWSDFPTQSPVCTGNDGIPAKLDGITFPKWRNESIKAAGNAIVPQVALQIFKTIEQYEEL